MNDEEEFDYDNLNENISRIRGEASNDPEYGFNDDWYTFMSKMMLLTPQSQGIRIQNYIIKKKGWRKIPSSMDRGDVINKSGEYFEIKTSIITSSNPYVNIVQIRLWQKIDGYYIFVIDATNNYETIQFILSKSDMINEVKLIGGSAHGTYNANKLNTNKEQAMHFMWDYEDRVCERWLKKYKHRYFP